MVNVKQLKARQYGAVVLGKHGVSEDLLWGPESLDFEPMLDYCKQNNLTDALNEITAYYNKL